MSTTDPTIMQMLTTQMRYMTQRQGVIAQNIANLDTPNYQAQDLKKLDFSDMANAEAGRLAMRQTSNKHLNGVHNGGSGNFSPETDRKNAEVTPRGNSVVLEDQMAKLSETGSEYQMSSSLFRKFHSLYRTALGNR